MYPQDMFGGILPPQYAPLIVVLLIWSIFWKGLALWHSARRADYAWFIAFLIINTVGILEIIYLFGFAKRSFNNLFSK